jgi:N4-gp56 family major capsid protein
VAINNASNFGADVGKYIQKKTLELTQQQIVLSQFGEKVPLPNGQGTTYNAFRYERVPLPFTTLSEGIAPAGQTMTVTQVTGAVAQWGDLIRVTDVAVLTIFHPVFTKAIDLAAIAVTETIERNTFNAVLGGTQVNYVNTRGSRAALVAGDVLNPHEVNRALSALNTLGARAYRSTGGADEKMKAASGAKGVSVANQPHFIAVIHPNVESDMRENPTIVTAWSYSDIAKLYNSEIGQWSQIRFTRSNMVPYWVGVAAAAGTAGTAGSLATNSYFVKITGSLNQNGYESLVSQTSGAVAVTGPTGSISVTVPSTPGYTYSVYVGLTASPVNLGTSSAGPTSGPLAGQATQLAPGATAIITAIGAAQVPPAAPAVGVTVYPTFVFGKEAFVQLELDSLKMMYLDKADKSDPNNQTRVVSWKVFYGTMIMNNTFFMRIESSSAFSATFG